LEWRGERRECFGDRIQFWAARAADGDLQGRHGKKIVWVILRGIKEKVQKNLQQAEENEDQDLGPIGDYVAVPLQGKRFLFLFGTQIGPKHHRKISEKNAIKITHLQKLSNIVQSA
jgi:hypothetical protein